MSERERLRIEARYYTFVTGELEKEAQVYERWQENYPRDGGAYDYLMLISTFLGNWPKALEEARARLRLDPSDWISYNNLAVVAKRMLYA